MVKIDIAKDKSIVMDSTKSNKMEKIQIYPSKSQHINFNNKNKPKLIMSPLTTMPSKKLMIATNGMSMKPIAPQSASMSISTMNNFNNNNVQHVRRETNEPKFMNGMAPFNRNENNLNAMTTTKTVTKNVVIPSPINDKSVIDGNATQKQQQQQLQMSSMNNNNMKTNNNNNNRSSNEEKNKETAGYRTENKKITLGDVHPYITCFLCKGYLIEATTIVECLHTFCHSCLIKHLSREKSCPQCDLSINKSKTNIK
jgi:polycomb group RING finger protein 4